MALKRSSKSMGSPVRRSSPSSPGLRHVDVLRAQQMTAGTSYAGWLCKGKACGKPIAIAGTPAEGPDDQQAAIQCPHCGDEDLYRWGARGEHPYAG